MTIRSRFAPSPTGYLHVGGARTALYAWLYAKGQGGKFILRIEDTDRERSTESSVRAILDGMEWLGLTADEGPIYQTDRFDRYKEVLEQLLSNGQAYRCYCTKERLDKLREDQQNKKIKPRYDGHCRDREDLTNTPHVIRFRNPLEGEVVFDDAVFGQITVSNQELDDLIIARTNGTPTYNFTVVVDDWDMGITHVIRGDDHINNTPRQINILKALDATIPQYAHLAMILGEDGKRLSKRHGAVSVLEFRDKGFLPQALLNYLVRLGWSYGDEEIFSMDEMIDYFDLKAIQRSAASFNMDKLIWLNQHYLKNLDIEQIKPHLAYQFKINNINITNGPTIEKIITIQRERAKTLSDMALDSRFFYEDITEYDPEAIDKHINSETVDILKNLLSQLKNLDNSNWLAPEIKNIIKSITKENNIKIGQIMMPFRIALCGGSQSPSVDLTAETLGKEKVIHRLEKGIGVFQ